MTSRSKDKLLVFGHEKSSPAFLNDSFLRENSSYQVEGFLRFGPRISMRIGIYKVYFVSDQAEFNRLVNRYNIKAILFTDYKVVKEESERLVRFCEKKKIRMLLLPSIDELQGGKIQLRALPEVRIEDLLGREEIRINMEEIAGSLKGKVVLVTGAAGSIGSELCRQLCHFGLKQLVCSTVPKPRCITSGWSWRKIPRCRVYPGHGRHSHDPSCRKHLSAFPSPVGLPCRRLQACAPDGREPLRSRPYECLRYA